MSCEVSVQTHFEMEMKKKEKCSIIYHVLHMPYTPFTLLKLTKKEKKKKKKNIYIYF